jgi:hypothetical protein
MKYLKYINESNIDYKKELVKLYNEIFKIVYEQNPSLKEEINDVNDLLLEFFDEADYYPEPEFKLFFYKFDANSFKNFSLRVFMGDLDNPDMIDEDKEDYEYVISTLNEKMEVYFFIQYSFPEYIRTNRHKYKYDANEINRRLRLIDFEPNYFTTSLIDDSTYNSIVCYKQIEFEYEFDYMSSFPELIRNDIKKFIVNNRLDNKGINDLSKIISKLSTNE